LKREGRNPEDLSSIALFIKVGRIVFNSISNIVERMGKLRQCVSWRVSMEISCHDEPSLVENVGTLQVVEADNLNSTLAMAFRQTTLIQ